MNWIQASWATIIRCLQMRQLIQWTVSRSEWKDSKSNWNAQNLMTPERTTKSRPSFGFFYFTTFHNLFAHFNSSIPKTVPFIKETRLDLSLYPIFWWNYSLYNIVKSAHTLFALYYSFHANHIDSVELLSIYLFYDAIPVY